MREVFDFILAVAAGVVGNYICKWLAGKKKDDNQHKKRRATDSSLFVIPCFVFDFMVTSIILVKTVDTNVMQLS